MLFQTPEEHTPSNLYQQAIKGIPFIVGVAGGLPNGCAISGCAVSFLAYNPPKGKDYKWYISGIFPANWGIIYHRSHLFLGNQKQPLTWVA